MVGAVNVNSGKEIARAYGRRADRLAGFAFVDETKPTVVRAAWPAQCRGMAVMVSGARTADEPERYSVTGAIETKAEGDRIGDAALGYAWHGWPIAPGAHPTPGQHGSWPVPLAAALPYRGPMGTNDVARCWHHHPHAVLLAAGLSIDVLAVRQPLASHLLDTLGEHGPIAALPDGWWLVFVEAGQPPEPLPGHTMRYHGPGSWVPLPPTRLGQGQLTWYIDPASTGWRPLRRDRLHHALCSGQPRPGHERQEPATTRPTAEPTTLPAGQPRRRRPPQRPAPSYQPRPKNITLLVAGDRPLFEVTHLTQQPPG